ncbi:MAG: LacI family DNA-binding transcriptional regulator [Saprospiraceae bacterium]|nr:LacI family DNA-binding transcriptional regulator [Saprospiraceae bacterium]MCB9325414.1 LacI family DNA-binding transcriptional regulator [Lewinellaceae bacterium]
MKKNKTITIHDLAEELKVSASTVSRALKEHPSIGKKTIKTVKELAEKRGYRPNRLAASLRNQQTHTIGVLVPWINRPFISSLIHGVEEAARAAGYQVIITQSHDNFEDEVDDLKAMFDSRISGMVVSLAMETQSYDHFTPFFKNNIPVVFVDRVPETLECHKVAIDNYTAGFKATEHLIEQGCRRIAHLSGASHQAIYKERLRGYLDALKQHQLPVDESLILKGILLSADEAISLTKYLLELPNPSDGIFSANDTAAVSAIQYAKSVGVKIPEELAIIGFNNDPISLIIEPQLSTVSHPAAEMGKIAVRKALELIESGMVNDFPKNQGIELETPVIARASSLKKGLK